MQLKAFDHVNVRTTRLQAMVDWYGQVLGMHPGKRPPFAFGGAWLYLGEQALVHLVEVKEPPKVERPGLEHFALSARGLGDFLAALKARGERHEIAVVPGFGIIQVNVWDPEGNHIHIDFGPEEKDALPA